MAGGRFAVPRLTRQLGNVRLLAGGLMVTVIGMAWLSRLSADTSYFMGIALPMVLIGSGRAARSGPSPHPASPVPMPRMPAPPPRRAAPSGARVAADSEFQCG